MSYLGQVHLSGKPLKDVWGYPTSVGAGSLVRAHSKNIRQKIEPDPSAPHCIRTERRHGYIVGE
jgi:DNA-binding response OmpR family regulator